MNIIQFRPHAIADIDYDKIRESVLGEDNLLNIEDSVRIISADYVDATDEQIDHAVGEIRSGLTNILRDNDCAKFFHDALLRLQEFNDRCPDGDALTTKFSTTNVSFTRSDNKIIEYHLLQVGSIRFIKAVRIIDKEDINVNN